MRDLRLKSLEVFETWRDPRFGVDISDLDVSKIVAYIKPDAKKSYILGRSSLRDKGHF